MITVAIFYTTWWTTCSLLCGIETKNLCLYKLGLQTALTDKTQRTLQFLRNYEFISPCQPFLNNDHALSLTNQFQIHNDKCSFKSLINHIRLTYYYFAISINICCSSGKCTTGCSYHWFCVFFYFVAFMGMLMQTISLKC